MPPRGQAAARLALVLDTYLRTFERPALVAAAKRLDHPQGAGRCPRCTRTYRRLLAGFWGSGVERAGMAVLRDPERDSVPTDRPLVVVVRHAGFLNYQLFAHLVFEDLGREPVMLSKRTVLADPGHAALLRHLRPPAFRWNREGRARVRAELIGLGAGLGAGEALVIAPEGTNFTARRRKRAIRELRRRSMVAQAAHADRLRHVLAPHLCGVRTLLEAAPGADVVFLAHTGLESLLSWAVPLGYPPPASNALRVTWWHVAAEEVPAGAEALDAWLLAWWARVDGWIATSVAERAAGSPPCPAVATNETAVA